MGRRLDSLRMKLRAALRRGHADAEMDAELAGHLEAETRYLMERQGCSEAEARRLALATMGRVDRIRDDIRESRGTQVWEQLRQDLRFAFRILQRYPVFAAAVIGTTLLGTGSTTAVFSVVDQVLIRPLPFAEPERLYAVNDLGMRGPFAMMRDASRVADYAAYHGVARAMNSAGREGPERLHATEVAPNFFGVLGVRPAVGRAFAAGEDRPGNTQYAVLSHRVWIDRFGGRPDAVGRSIVLDEASYQVIGVMPASFAFPSPKTDLWLPLVMDPRQVGDYWGSGGVAVLARLRPGASEAAAEAELRATVPRIRSAFPWRMPDAWAAGARMVPLQKDLTGEAQPRSLLLMAAVALVLAIAIANAANLLMAQAVSREREFAMRLALGASRGRLVRQMLTESLLLAAAGGAASIALAFAQLHLLKLWLPADTPRLAEVAIDGRILVFSAAVSLGSGLLFGLWPAWRMWRLQDLRSVTGRRRAGGALVLAEVAVATVLLVGTGLMLRSLMEMLRVDPGFRVRSLVTAELTPTPRFKTSPTRMNQMLEEVRGQVAKFPGVTGVAAMSGLPLTRDASTFAAAIEDHPRPPQAPAFVLWSTAVTPDHAETLGLRLLRGRRFADTDRRGQPLAVLISKATAERYWPNQDPIGRRLKPVWDREWRTIVGVVSDVRTHGITGPPDWVDGEIYLPMGQALFVPPVISLVASVEGDDGDLQRQLPRLVQGACLGCSLTGVRPMGTVVDDAVRTPRSTASLLTAFAALALALVGAGVYGVMSQAVARRTRELGVRLALGATGGQVAWEILRDSLAHALLGTALGLAAAWPLASLLRTLLYGVAPHDWASFLAAPAAILAMTAVANLAPMRRASRISPAVSLKEG